MAVGTKKKRAYIRNLESGFRAFNDRAAQLEESGVMSRAEIKQQRKELRDNIKQECVSLLEAADLAGVIGANEEAIEQKFESRIKKYFQKLNPIFLGFGRANESGLARFLDELFEDEAIAPRRAAQILFAGNPPLDFVLKAITADVDKSTCANIKFLAQIKALPASTPAP